MSNLQPQPNLPAEIATSPSLQKYHTRYGINLPALLSSEDGISQVSMALSRAKVDDAIAAPTVTTLERELGTEAILAILLFELEKINRLYNANDKLKLTHDQCADIAVMLIEEFPHESLEDFTIALRKGITGAYDDKLLRLDVQVIFRWVRSFLDQKAQRAEVIHKEAKQEEIREYTPEEKANIKKILDESWVGQTLRQQTQHSEEYKRFKGDYAVKRAAERQKNEESQKNTAGKPGQLESPVSGQRT